MKRDMKKLVTALCFIFVMLVSLAGCGEAKPKVFDVGKLSVELTTDFEVESNPNADIYIISDAVAVIGTAEEKAALEEGGIEGIESIEDYANLNVFFNKIENPSDLYKTEHGVVYYWYDKDLSGQTCTTVTAVLENKDAYWLVSFVCYKDAYEGLKDSILHYVDTITVVD